MSRRIKGPQYRIPALGSSVETLRFAQDPLGHMSHLFARYGDIAALVENGDARIFSTSPACRRVVFGRGPDVLEAVERNAEAFHRSGVAGRMYPGSQASGRRGALVHWGMGLFAKNGTEHAKHRRLMQPSLATSEIEGWIPSIISIVDAVSESWAPGDTVDIHDAMIFCLSH